MFTIRMFFCNERIIPWTLFILLCVLVVLTCLLALQRTVLPPLVGGISFNEPLKAFDVAHGGYKDDDQNFRASVPSCQKQKECLFIVSPGLSGSTALMDALNQFPGVFIRGENGAMMSHVWNLYTTYDRFSAHYMDDSIEAEMAKYKRFVHRGAKPAWYNEFNHDKIHCLPYDIFRTLYGYSGFQEYIVGFKETRFWEVDRLLKPRELGDWAEYRCDNLDPDKYEDFVQNLMFHESLCENTKFIFNHRRTYDYTKGTGFYVGPARGKVLKMRLEWAETFASEHPNNTMMVYYEDMFDPSINGTVMSQIARFLGRKIPTGITFARLPKY